jgi:hypothetical protein
MECPVKQLAFMGLYVKTAFFKMAAAAILKSGK